LSTVFLFQAYGIYLLGNLVFETSTGVLQTFKRFDRISKAQSSGTIFTAVAIGAVFFLRGNFFLILTAYLAGKLLAGFLAGLFAAYELNHNLGTGWLWTRAVHGDRSPFHIGDWRGLLTFAFNTNLNGTVNLIMRDSAPLFLSLFATQAEVGYFKLAHSLVVTLIMVPIEPFIWPTYSEINETILHAQWQSTKRLLRRVSIIAAVWTVGAGAVLTAFGWWLIPFIYGADTAPAYPASVILLLGFGFANILHWNRPLLLAFGNPSSPLIVSALVGAVQIALIFILVPYFGYIGMSWLMTGYFIVSIGIIVWMGLREIRKREASQ
jgi:O-antigen/teichoic acid export membrane protein